MRAEEIIKPLDDMVERAYLSVDRLADLKSRVTEYQETVCVCLCTCVHARMWEGGAGRQRILYNHVESPACVCACALVWCE